MTSNPQTNYSPNVPTDAASRYRPSVPISVYRELATELQTTQAQLDSLKAQNQQLVQQNAQLREEVSKVLQSTQSLSKVLHSWETNSFSPPQSFETVETPKRVSPPPKVVQTREVAPPPPPTKNPPAPPPEKLVAEIPHKSRRPTPSESSSSDVNGWLLAIAIALIVFSAFTVSFFVARPLLQNNNNN
ncbi:MAG: bZIP transcription factor [Oscillatoria sp. PMC 1068.18]|nr:bZIP transcription factor [Oscillatoria sp. PMC 1076.18]MEC4990177.1 bZIP transcription factor [Oscillatoria sp. PMC 1068.18]